MNIKVDSSVANPDPHHLEGDHDGVVSDPNVTTEIAWDRHLLAVAAEDPPLVHRAAALGLLRSREVAIGEAGDHRLALDQRVGERTKRSGWSSKSENSTATSIFAPSAMGSHPDGSSERPSEKSSRRR